MITDIELVNSRRLTGPNLLSKLPGAIIDLKVHSGNAETIVNAWENYISKILRAIKWAGENYTARILSGGISLAISAPIDALYASTKVNEYALELARESFFNKNTKLNPKKINDLIYDIHAESNPALLKLKKNAAEHHLCFLSDDDNVSVGLGTGSQTWRVDEIPKNDDINWEKLHNIPIYLITGTNGKSTTVRVCNALFKAAGKVVGTTSTDFLKIDDVIIDRGDYSGPGGARTILRNKKVEIAILEVARGGILRRGLAVPEADTAIITNIASDHLGQYGIDTVEELAEVKFVVSKAVPEQNTIIINADNSLSLNESKNINHQKCFISIAKTDFPLPSCYLRKEIIYFNSEANEEEILSVMDIPITLKGAAKHNIMNVMSAISLAKTFGMKNSIIAKGLRSFKNNPEENPGRANLFSINGANVLVDFAHNEHGLNAIIETASNFKVKRRLITIGQAGDRSDKDIRKLVDAAIKMAPDCIVITEIPEYLRGRRLGEIPKLIYQYFVESGVNANKIVVAKNILHSVDLAIEWSKPGDLLLLLILNQRDAVLEKLTQLSKL